MNEAFDIFRREVPSVKETAGLARKAVFEGIALGSVLRQASRTPGVDAHRLFVEVLRILEGISLPAEVKAGVVYEIEQLDQISTLEERRRKQLALLGSPLASGFGRAALEVTEELDEDEAF